MKKADKMSKEELKLRIEYLENYIEILTRSIEEAEGELKYLKRHDIPPFLQQMINKEQEKLATFYKNLGGSEDE